MAKILQLDSGGQPLSWISWQDAIVYHSKGLVAWSIGEENTIARGGNSRLTGLQSVISTASIIAIKGSTNKRKYKSAPLTNQSLFRRDKGTCAYCGKQFSEHKLSRDHIVPTSRGGSDSWGNCVTSCTSCNQKKDDQLLSECGMQLLYVPYVPSRAEHLILQNRNILSDQMDFLLAFVSADSRLLQ